MFELYKEDPRLPSELLDPQNELPDYIRTTLDLTYKIEGKGGITIQEEIQEILHGKRTMSGVPIDEPPLPKSDAKYWVGKSFEDPAWKKSRIEMAKNQRNGING